ncbi:MAG: hypothetical protein ACRCZ9_09460 [Fusobacteriaceae bacterium]
MFIPVRKEVALEKITQPVISEIKKSVSTISSETKEKIRIICVENFEKTFDIKEDDENKIKLAQLERFLQELQKRKYDFNSNYIKDFIDNQIKRKIAKSFYEEFRKQFVEKTDYSFRLLENSDDIPTKILNKKIVNMIKLHLRAEIGKNTLDKKLG